MKIQREVMVAAVTSGREWDEVQVADRRAARFELLDSDQGEAQGFTLELNEAEEAALRPGVGHAVTLTIEFP